MNFAWAVLVLGALILVHEFGHFIFAKLFGVTVHKFSLGLGPALISKRFGETDYMISMVPFGGYVQMAGEDGADPNDGKTEPDKFLDKKSAWQRAVIIAAGPVFNVLFAVMLFISSNLIYGTPVITTKIGGVRSGYPADVAGIKAGDVITVLGSEFDSEIHRVSEWQDVVSFLKNNGSGAVSFWITRGDKKLGYTVRPQLKEVKNVYGEAVKQYVVGIEPPEPVMTKGVALAFSRGLENSFSLLKIMTMGLWKLITGSVPAKNSLGGPIMIFGIGSQAANRGFMDLMSFAAVISLNLGLLNILPVPVFDGGHLLFLGIEKVRGKPVRKETQAAIGKVFMILLLLLFVFTTFNDISRLIGKG